MIRLFLIGGSGSFQKNLPVWPWPYFWLCFLFSSWSSSWLLLFPLISTFSLTRSSTWLPTQEYCRDTLKGRLFILLIFIFRNVFKFSYLTLPCSLISWVCFVSSQRKEGYAEADTCSFAIFHLLSALSILYIVIYPHESRWFETCRKRRVNDQITQEYDMSIRGKVK